ncbi:MAG: NfeD family protein [Chloroflexota bacterium]
MWLWIWIFLAVLAAIGEVLTTDLFLASIAFGAVVAALLALTIAGVVIQIAAFGALSLVGIAVVRPLLKHALGIDGMRQLIGPVANSHLEGRRATVTQTVTAHGGQVRIGQGEFWSARAYDPDKCMDVGSTVEVLLVEGLTALVEPCDSLALSGNSNVAI